MNIKNLRVEITTDPLSRGYASMTDEEIAISLNEENRSILRPIASTELLAWSAPGRLFKIKSAIENGASDEIKSIAEAAYLLVTRDSTSLDLSLPDRMLFLDSLVSAGIFSAEDRTSLISIATQPVSRGFEVGIGFVRPGEVSQARI